MGLSAIAVIAAMWASGTCRAASRIGIAAAMNPMYMP